MASLPAGGDLDQHPLEREDVMRDVKDWTRLAIRSTGGAGRVVIAVELDVKDFRIVSYRPLVELKGSRKVLDSARNRRTIGPKT